MPRKETNTGPISAQAQQDLVSEGIENFELPKSIVTKIAKSAIPDNAKLQKETVLSLVKGSTVFINYLAATAHDVALSKQHKSISASDVLKALEIIEFGDLVDVLSAELQVYRELAKTDKSKKGSSNITAGASASAVLSTGPSASAARPKLASGAAPASASAAGMSISAARPKGKEREGAPLAAPLLAQPYGAVPLPAQPYSVPPADSAAMDVDEDATEGEPEPAPAEGAGLGGEEEEEEEDEEEDATEDEGDGDEELEDRMAVEEAEIARDARGLEGVEGPGGREGVVDD